MTPEERLDHLAGIAALCEELAAFPSPVIAAVHGYALGGGTEVALACDIRIAADTAIFGLPEVSVGLIPGAGGVTRLPKLVGAGRARELMFSARRIDAVEADRIGLVELVVPLDTLETSARDLAGDDRRPRPAGDARPQAGAAFQRGPAQSPRQPRRSWPSAARWTKPATTSKA